MSLNTHSRSMLLLLLPMVVWGSAFAVTKGLVELWPPFTLALIRVGVGTFVLLPIATARHQRGSHLPCGTIWLMGLLGVTLSFLTFNLAMVYVSASQGALVQASIPAMT